MKDKQGEYVPPQNIFEVNAKLDFNEPLDEDDPRYVETEQGRGEFSFNKLLTTLGVDVETLYIPSPINKSYLLFCGHRGCGKSTELRRLSRYLHQEDLFFVISLDTVLELDTNNLQYSDVLIALANKLLMKLKDKNIKINGVYLKNLNQWFSEKILKSEKLKDFSLEVETGASARGGIPFLLNLTAKLTGKLKSGATYKEEIRQVLKNSFSEFAFSFNQLVKAAESELKRAGKEKKFLFVIDGTDRLNSEDSHRFFIEDVNQLKQIEANFIYCAPIHLLYEGNQVQQDFKSFILPMVKIFDKDSGTRYDKGCEVLKEIIYKRADKKLFESEAVVDLLIENSGGNPRDLLKLLYYALLESDMKCFKEKDVEKAIHQLAMDYQRFLNTEDYDILYEIDQSEQKPENTEQIRRLLYNLAVLQYNNYWWRSHPVIRNLEGYKKRAGKKNRKPRVK